MSVTGHLQDRLRRDGRCCHISLEAEAAAVTAPEAVDTGFANSADAGTARITVSWAGSEQGDEQRGCSYGSM